MNDEISLFLENYKGKIASKARTSKAATSKKIIPTKHPKATNIKKFQRKRLLINPEYKESLLSELHHGLQFFNML